MRKRRNQMHEIVWWNEELSSPHCKIGWCYRNNDSKSTQKDIVLAFESEAGWVTVRMEEEKFFRLAIICGTNAVENICCRNGLQYCANKAGYTLKSMSNLPGTLGLFAQWIKDQL